MGFTSLTENLWLCVSAIANFLYHQHLHYCSLVCYQGAAAVRRLAAPLPLSHLRLYCRVYRRVQARIYVHSSKNTSRQTPSDIVLGVFVGAN